jgi:anion-transporting  ArsA/GET3 family ATPase
MEGLRDRRLLYVTGKGGVGKTTVALALALAAQRAGRRTCVVELAAQGRVPALFGRSALDDGREQELADGLWALTVDVRVAVREWFGAMLPGPLAGMLVQSGAFAAFAQAAPGARELTAAAKLWELVQPRRWTAAAPFDVVVVDAPSSGHGLALLRAPSTFAEIGRVGPLGGQAGRVRDFLADPASTGLVVVAAAAETAVSEALALEERLPLAGIVVNGLLPRRFTREQAERVDATVDGPVGALVARAAARTREQQAELRRLRRSAGAAVATLPFVCVPELGLEDVRRLSALLDA